MNVFEVDFSRQDGPVRPMHSVNNGPGGGRGINNDDSFKKAGFPYARLHDSSFYSGYGAEHAVDVANLFPNFDADVNDPSSYDFALTDDYLQRIIRAGTKVFYRLGHRIEHERKRYGTQVPKDFRKWAEICEHIILHYNEGWADGFRMGIEYWEIWNEPNCRNTDGSNPCWQGTDEQFCELFYVALTYLKERFPELKIGGPALTHVDIPFTEKLLGRLREGGHPPLDFYSFHGYASTPAAFAEPPRIARALLDSYGYTDTEIILNEWNYVKNWASPEAMKEAYQVIGNVQGASFVAGALCVAQNVKELDHFMYYDARPSTVWNGLFAAGSLETLKPYESMAMFHELYQIGTAVKTRAEGDVFGCAAYSGGKGAAMLTLYSPGDEAEPVQEVTVRMIGLPGRARVRYALLDSAHDTQEVRADIVCGGEFTTILPIERFSTMLIRLDADC